MHRIRRPFAGPAFVVAACLLALALIGGVSGPAAARTLSVHVVGPQGQPLQYAALEIDWPGAPAPRVPAAPLRMAQRDLRFVPHMLVVPVGARVSFPNYDRTRHHVYSFSKAKTFDIKLYVGLPDHPVRFPNPGVVTLGCNIHDQMQAFLIVTRAARTRVTDVHGNVDFPDLPSRTLTLSIWHPWMATEEERVRRSIAPGTDRITVELDDIHAPPPSTRDNTLQKRFDALAH